MALRRLGGLSILIAGLAIACGNDDTSAGGQAGNGGDAGAPAAGAGGADGGSAGQSAGGSATGGSAGASGAGASAGGSSGVGGSAVGGGAGVAGNAGEAAVGHPELFSDSVFEMDFSQGDAGRFRANAGAWEDFAPWNQPGQGGGWRNAGVYVQTTDAIRTELVPDALGTGRVLRTYIQAGDQWKSSATYPRTELTSEYTADVAFNSEWRLELPFYAEGDVSSSGTSIIAFQFHHNGNTGSPPFGFSLSSGELRLYLEETPDGPNEATPLFPLKAGERVELVVEVKFGYPADGAYFRLWANGTQYVDIIDKLIGYPDREATAGYWKFCSLYDWGNRVEGSRSVYSGPLVRLLKRP